MKQTFILMLALVTFKAFGATLIAGDYESIKAIAITESSQAMLVGNYIGEHLQASDFDQINITTDILDNKNIVKVQTTILPSEDNCGCQDIFEVSMEIEKKLNSWELVKNSSVVNHIVIEH